MKTAPHLPMPAKRILAKLGADMRDARLRRRLPVALVAERAGISRGTLRKVEKGDATVSLGAFTAVLFALGLIERLGDLADASHDQVGRQLEEENLPQRIHLPK